MNIYDFMSNSPILTFFIVIAIGEVIVRIFSRLFRIINLFRNGYPPEYCDADGDFKDKEEELK